MIPAFLVFAFLPLRAPKAPPAIAVYFDPGYVLERGNYEDVAIAVWKDGRIIWRDPFPEWDRRNGVWGLNKGTFYEARIPVNRVLAALRKLDKGGIFKTKGWTNMPPDSSSTAIWIRYGDKDVRFDSAELNPSSNPDGRGHADVWKRGVAAWNLSLTTSKSLIPARGRKIPKPNLNRLLMP